MKGNNRFISQRQYNRSFEGACIDSVAHRSVIGLDRAKKYSSSQYISLHPQGTASIKTNFQFANTILHLIGDISIHTRIQYIVLNVDIVHSDIPLLLGLDMMEKYQLVPNNIEIVLEGRSRGPNDSVIWQIPLHRKNGHKFCRLRHRIDFSAAELNRLHEFLFIHLQKNCIVYFNGQDCKTPI
jgi:hypothetical protein